MVEFLIVKSEARGIDGQTDGQTTSYGIKAATH